MYDAWEKMQRFPAGGGISEARFSMGDTDASQLGDASLSILEIMGDESPQNIEKNLGWFFISCITILNEFMPGISNSFTLFCIHTQVNFLSGVAQT